MTRASTLALALPLLAFLNGMVGCGHLREAKTPKAHASTQLLNGGAAKRLSAKERADVQFTLARSMEGQKDLGPAREAYLEVLRNDPRRADAHARLAMLLDQEGDAKGADRHFSQAVRYAPKNPDVLCDQGYYLYLHRRWGDAESSLRKALKVDPRHARSHNNLGLVLARRGEESAALAEFGRAGCDEADSRANLALALAEEGRFEDAKASYAVALAAKPGLKSASDGLRASSVALSASGRSADPQVQRAGFDLPALPSASPSGR